MYHAIKNAAVKIYERFIKLKGAPREIALGFALGLFIGMSPFFGMHIAIGVLCASLLGWSKIAAAIAVNITNVFTAPFIYPVTYMVGAKITGFASNIRWPTSIDFNAFMQLLKESPLIILDLCVGGAILGIPIAIAGYYLAFNAITAYRRSVRDRLRELKRQRKLKSQAKKKNKKRKPRLAKQQEGGQAKTVQPQNSSSHSSKNNI